MRTLRVCLVPAARAEFPVLFVGWERERMAKMMMLRSCSWNSFIRNNFLKFKIVGRKRICRIIQFSLKRLFSMPESPIQTTPRPCGHIQNSPIFTPAWVVVSTKHPTAPAVPIFPMGSRILILGQEPFLGWNLVQIIAPSAEGRFLTVTRGGVGVRG